MEPRRSRKEYDMKKDILLAVLIASLLMSGCGAINIAPPAQGNVLPLGIGDTIRYLGLVFRNDPSTLRMMSPDGNSFLFGFMVKDNVWGWLAMGKNGSQINELTKFCGSQYANCLTFTGLVKFLENGGWEYVWASAIPPSIVSTFGTLSAFMAKFGTIVTTPLIMVIPGGNFVNPFPTVLN